MQVTIDFENLRGITGGDRGVENRLFAVLVESAHECLANLRRSLELDDAVLWRQSAHAFKGASMNLGAIPLGQLCAEAQRSCDAPMDAKRSLFDAILSEWTEVHTIIMQQAAESL